MKKHSSHQVRARSLLLSLAMVGLVSLSGSACSDETDNGLSAREVCDASLSPSAAASLERLAEDDKFTESTSSKLSETAHELRTHRQRDDPDQMPHYAILCQLEDPGGSSPALDVDFRWMDVDPRRLPPDRGLKPEPTYYRIGERAFSSVRFGAHLDFRCTTRDQPEAEARWIKASLTVAYRHADPEAQAKDQMLILHSVSRRLAAALKCSDANLPASPDLRPISVEEVLKDVR